jgi:hypothetical protein
MATSFFVVQETMAAAKSAAKPPAKIRPNLLCVAIAALS